MLLRHLVADPLGKTYGRLIACRDVSFALYSGEVLAVVGESGSGKSTLLQLLSAQLAPSAGRVSYRMRDGALRDLASLGEAERRFLFRTDWGYVHQDPAQGLRMAVSAGANVGERLMAVGWNHYGRIRDEGDTGGATRAATSSAPRGGRTPGAVARTFRASSPSSRCSACTASSPPSAASSARMKRHS